MARQVEGPWYRASKGTWYATVEGRSVSLKVKGEAKEAEALKAWHRLMADPPKPKPIAEPKPMPMVEALTIQGIVDAFLADAESRLKPNTVRIYRYDLGTLCSAVGTVNADALTAQAVGRWLHGLTVGSTTKAMTLRSVSACLGWGVATGLLPLNPCKQVPKPRSRSRSTEAVITEADHLKLLASATPDFRLVLRVLHATGCRPGEAARISAETFDPTNGVVRLLEHKADATGKPRLIFLTDDVCELLKVQAERFKVGALLRSRKGVAWNGRSITQAMMRVAKKAKVKGIAYGYRHTFATRALANGVPDAHVAALLGHSSTAMLHRHYSHLTSQAGVLRDALAKVSS